MKEKVVRFLMKRIPASWLDFVHRHKKPLGAVLALAAFTSHMFGLHEVESGILYVGCTLGVGFLPNGEEFPDLHKLRSGQENPYLPPDYKPED